MDVKRTGQGREWWMGRGGLGGGWGLRGVGEWDGWSDRWGQGGVAGRERGMADEGGQRRCDTPHNAESA